MLDGLISTAAILALIYFVVRLHSRVGALEAEVAKLRGVVQQEAREAAAARLEAAATEGSASAKPGPVPEFDEAVAESEVPPGPPVAGPWTNRAPAGDAPVPSSAPAPPRRPDIESALGTRWAVWIGGLAMAFGAVFLIRYSIEAGIFGPGVRLALAALLGIALVAGGEFLRRTGFRVPVQGAKGAYVPGILTAAGAFALFGTVYAAHGVYGFIGPVAAFTLLGLIGVGAIAAALVHGQALAGLGLLGSMLTPLLVASEAPSSWTLFGYLAVVIVANTAIARIRSWSPVAAAGFAGIGFWSLVYLADAFPVEHAPVLFSILVMLAALAFLWLRGDGGKAAWRDTPSLAAALSAGLPAGAMLMVDALVVYDSAPWGAAILVAMVAVAWLRGRALALLHVAGAMSILGFLRFALTGGFSLSHFGGVLWIEGFGPGMSPWTALSVGPVLGCVFLVAGLRAAWRSAGDDPQRSAAWALWASAVPVAILASLWFALGQLDLDFRYGTLSLLLCGLLAASAEAVARREEPAQRGGPAVTFLLAGAFAAAVLFIHAVFGTLLTTILSGLLALPPAFATRLRAWPALGWLCVAALALTALRILPDPTIVGASRLGTTPFFNALLPGYGLPALAFVAAAWQLGRTTGGRPRLVMEAGAALFSLLALAMLVRHAMNGGVIDGTEPQLAEQAIYTLMTLGAGAILIALDLRSPSPVFRHGSMVAGVVSAAFIAIQHFIVLNPLFTNEPVGPIPLVDLLLLGYLLPGLGAVAVALFARGRRPRWYVAMLALLSATLGFAWATLSLRRAFQGEHIGLANGMGQVETYAYSALWLALGVLVLLAGVRMRSQALRIASAIVIAVAVGKVFLFDMSELQGVLRALSFIGLGAVLIGIGLFYQRLLVRSRGTEGEPATPPAPGRDDRPAAP